MDRYVPPGIQNWDEYKRANFGKVALQFEHQYDRHPLFSDEALARLLENVERQDYYVNTMDVSGHNTQSRREGEIGNLSGIEILDAVRRGHIWILLLRPDRVEPLYNEVLKEIYEDIARNQPGFKSFLEKMTILISSPLVQVYYHCDIPGQTLWQVRGTKRVFVYPNRPPFLNQVALEKIVLGEAHEISLASIRRSTRMRLFMICDPAKCFIGL